MRVFLKEGLGLNTPIYRYMKYEHLTQFLEKGEYAFSNIARWEDPYENYMGRCLLLNKYGQKINLITFSRYGQCWTTKKESDAMWRIYSNPYHDEDKQIDRKRMSVRITSTPSKLQKLPENIDINYGYIGPVEYRKQSDIDIEITNLSFLSFSEYWEKWEEIFFIKREEFSHEVEVRLLFSVIEERGRKMVYASISPFDLIEEITFDHRLRELDYKTLRAELVEKYGYPIDRVNQSQLYKFIPRPIRVDKE